MLNRQWLLARRPQGLCVPEDFLYRQEDFDPPALGDGEILIRNIAFLCAPTIRNWMDEGGNNFIPSIRLGEPVRGPCAARVIASANPDFPVGSRLCTIGNWQDIDVVSSASALIRPIPEGYSFIEALGPLGLNALTAYFGLREIGKPQPGETLLVSGAAGSVGSNVAQIGKILGCRVIGIAGGKAKCGWLLDIGCVDHCIDYTSEDIEGRIRRCARRALIFISTMSAERHCRRPLTTWHGAGASSCAARSPDTTIAERTTGSAI